VQILEPISKLLSAAIGYKARGSAFSTKRVLDVLQHASEPFSPRALTTSFSLDLAAKPVLKWVLVYVHFTGFCMIASIRNDRLRSPAWAAACLWGCYKCLPCDTSKTHGHHDQPLRNVYMFGCGMFVSIPICPMNGNGYCKGLTGSLAHLSNGFQNGGIMKHELARSQ